MSTMFWTHRARIIVICTTALLTTSTSPSQAFIFGLFRRRAPACAVPPPPVAPAAPQVRYVPQTAYRAQLINVPVTTYRPVASVHPCTGCRTTTLQPVVSYRQQTQYVPYTTYRLVYSQPPARSCGVRPAAPLAAAPACCSARGAQVTAYPPTQAYAIAPSTAWPTPAYSSSPAPSGYTSQGSVGTTTPVPSLMTPPQVSPAVPSSNYPAPLQAVPRNSTPPAPTDTKPRMKPIPTEDPAANRQGETNADPTSGPILNDPHNRTTRYPIQRVWTSSHIRRTTPNTQVPALAARPIGSSHHTGSTTASQPLDDGGWRASGAAR